MDPAPMRADRLVTPVSLAVLAAAAVAINVHAPTVFFNSQIMLGGSLGVFALLQFGWPGLVVGMAALAVTFMRWGHPLELVVGTGFLVWLRIYLDRFAAGRPDRGHGRALLAATAYWLLLGFWLEMAFFRLAFGLGNAAAVALGLKEAVSGLSSATLGFLLFAVVRAVRSRKSSGSSGLHDLASGLALAATTIPSIALVIVLSGQVKHATLQAQLAEMRAFGMQAARATSPDAATTPEAAARSDRGMNFTVRDADRILASSDAALFARIAEEYEVETPSRTGLEALAVYRPRHDAAVIAKDAESYMMATFPLSGATTDAGQASVSVAQPLGVLLSALDYGLIIPTLLVILGFFVAGAAVSSVVDTVSERRVQAERRLEQAARQLTENDRRFRYFFDVPMIGTAITSRTKGWIAANDETCQILGYPREELFGKTWADITHPDDLPADEAQFERMLRREIDGYQLEKRFIRRDGSVVHTLIAGGCGPIGHATPDTFYVTIVDISDRKQLEAEVATMREREKLAERKQRESIEQKLRASLNAAAVAHEINQPLSCVLLRAKMSLETATGADRDMLAALVADAERVVSVIRKMKVLLRNVETIQCEVDLADITASAMQQVKRPLDKAGVVGIRRGVDRGCLLLGDEVQLQMIVTNLVANAIEAIEGAGGDTREIVVEHHVHADTVELVVGDSGPGWPGGTIDAMLLQTTKPGGAGIGLYVVKTAVENHRGQITVGRSPLGGAEFRITFPRFAAAAT